MSEPRTEAGRVLLREHSSGTPHMARHIIAIEDEAATLSATPSGGPLRECGRCGDMTVHGGLDAATPSEEATGLNAETLGQAMERRGIRVSRADVLYIVREYARLTEDAG